MFERGKVMCKLERVLILCYFHQKMHDWSDRFEKLQINHMKIFRMEQYEFFVCKMRANSKCKLVNVNFCKCEHF